jgi:hypothetical protein
MTIRFMKIISYFGLFLFILNIFNVKTIAQEVTVINSPLFEDQEGTIRVRVTDNNKKPIMGLQEQNFNIFVDNQPVRLTNWKSPQATVPPPVYIIVLLDMSGSMRSLDSGGKTRLEGAIEAIQDLSNITAQRGGDTQIAVVPFGEGGNNCEGYVINNNVLNNFFSADSPQLQQQLNELKNVAVCASTNLYEPLSRAIRFLSNRDDVRFYPPSNSDKVKPRLSVILLSDGYHNHPNERRDFEVLTSLLNTYDHITVHTLGYGLTPVELAQKYNLSQPVTRDDINQNRIPEDEFVDEVRLAEIAQITGGIAEFSGDSQEIAHSLRLFLDALLGEYELSFWQENAERGAQHQLQVKVNFPDGGVGVDSELRSYLIPIFGRSLPLRVRIIIMALVFSLLIIGGVIPFYLWGKWLKDKA